MKEEHKNDDTKEFRTKGSMPKKLAESKSVDRFLKQ